MRKQQAEPGTFIVVVKNAKNLPRGLNPSVNLTLNGSKRATTSRANAQAPKWSETFDFDVENGRDASLGVDLVTFDEIDGKTAYRVVGQAKMVLQPLNLKSGVDMWGKGPYGDNKKVGTIYLEVQFLPSVRSTPLKATPHAAEDHVTGVNLSAVSHRYSVTPRKLVDEISKLGTPRAAHQSEAAPLARDKCLLVGVIVLLVAIVVSWMKLSNESPSLIFQSQPISVPLGGYLKSGEMWSSSTHFIEHRKDGNVVLAAGQSSKEDHSTTVNTTIWESGTARRGGRCWFCTVVVAADESSGTHSISIRGVFRVLARFDVEDNSELREHLSFAQWN